MRAHNTAFHRRFRNEFHAWNATGIHLLNERIFLIQKLIQSGGKHIAGRAHSTVQIKNSHRFASV